MAMDPEWSVQKVRKASRAAPRWLPMSSHSTLERKVAFGSPLSGGSARSNRARNTKRAACVRAAEQRRVLRLGRQAGAPAAR